MQQNVRSDESLERERPYEAMAFAPKRDPRMINIPENDLEYESSSSQAVHPNPARASKAQPQDSWAPLRDGHVAR